ncbi:MAG: 16S rRNA (guanine(966)-N(2))-methyltransferase RsmD [Desulfovibrionales bacterium]|nr:16S rRNA (guanine(966)-N(2))-methyltransferase RsmD [Desulfovibrionales bacterium]
MRVIAGQYGGRVLRTSSGPGYRPATGKVRESVFSMLESLGVVWDGLCVADIFAGSGSLGIEALSRGASHAVFVEKSAQAAAVLRGNLEMLGAQRSCWTVVRDDALRWLGKDQLAPQGLVFIDPPYGQELLAPAVRLLLDKGGLKANGLLCVEVEAQIALDTPPHPSLVMLRNKLYGQTRICIWGRNVSA